MARTKPVFARDLVTATHEAGHAVAAWHYRRRFTRLSVVADGESAGHMRWSTREIRRRLELHEIGFVDVAGVMICFAGAVAERRLTGRASHIGAEADYRAAVDIARGVGPDGTGGPEDAPIVSAILRAAHGETVELVDMLWPYIERLSRALVDQNTMTYRRVVEALAKED